MNFIFYIKIYTELKMCTLGCLFLNLVLTLVMLVFSIINIIKFSESHNFENTLCNVTRIEYPSEIPTNIENYKNFVECDCGRRCESNLGICNQIYITDENSQEILLQDRYDSDDNTCSLRESKCKNGERIDNRITKIYENIEKMKYYENSITNNTLIDCHKFDDVYFLNDYNYFKEMIIFVSIMLFSSMIILIITKVIIPRENRLNDYK